MARELIDVRICENPPGINGWLMEARLIDESEGYHDTEFGPTLNWDKSLSVISEMFDVGRLEEAITEMVCDG